MNIYKRLMDLLPTDKIDVGTVIQVYSDGVLIELQSGGYVKVLGNGVVIGQKVFIKSGQIVSNAPDLVGVEIQI